MINAIDHELTGAIDHAEIELHETTMGGGRWLKREKKVGEKRKDRGLLLSANLFTKKETEGKEKKDTHAFMRWNNGIIDGEKGNETRTEIERSYPRFPGG